FPCRCKILSDRNRSLEDEERPRRDQTEADEMVHRQLLTEPEDREPGEYDQGDDFLQGLEFGGAVNAIADAVRGDDEAIFEKGDPPRNQHRKPYGPRHRAKLTVPGEGHEDVRHEQEADRREIGGHFVSFVPVSGSTSVSSAAKKC